jgi:hypothetical protein
MDRGEKSVVTLAFGVITFLLGVVIVVADGCLAGIHDIHDKMVVNGNNVEWWITPLLYIGVVAIFIGVIAFIAGFFSILSDSGNNRR